ncbi:MAG TPA: hypothetical protein VHQ04_01675 [Puia sp.]|nr:hypothetical protein [Puia sp.]
MTLDWYFGLGYGTQSFSKKNVSPGDYPGGQPYESYCFSHMYGGPQMPLIYTAGLAIGILVK